MYKDVTTYDFNILIIASTIVLLVLGVSIIYLFVHSLKQKEKLKNCLDHK